MPDVTELFRSRGDAIGHATLTTGYVSTLQPAPAAFSDPVWVILPSHSTDRPYGPLAWPAIHGAALPVKGTAVTVGFDDSNTPFVTWWAAAFGSGVDAATAYALRAGFEITGGGTIGWSAAGVFSWTARFIYISAGNSSATSTNGYFDIVQPGNGVALTGIGGAANRTWGAGGVTLQPWEALYYILPLGNSNASVPANFRVASYTAGLTVPWNWVLVALNNGDFNTLRVCAGMTLPLGAVWSSTGALAPPYGMIYAASALTLGNGSSAQLALDGTQAVGGGVTLTSGALVVPRAGLYLVTARITVLVATNTMADFVCYVFRNGSFVLGSDNNAYTTPVGDYQTQTATTLVVCSAGDSLQLYGRADSATAQKCLTSQGLTFLHAVLQGPS